MFPSDRMGQAGRQVPPSACACSTHSGARVLSRYRQTYNDKKKKICQTYKKAPTPEGGASCLYASVSDSDRTGTVSFGQTQKRPGTFERDSYSTGKPGDGSR